MGAAFSVVKRARMDSEYAASERLRLLFGTIVRRIFAVMFFHECRKGDLRERSVEWNLWRREERSRANVENEDLKRV
jgi:hypothetical protein